MSTEGKSPDYGSMLKTSEEHDEKWYWVEETLEEAARLYSQESSYAFEIESRPSGGEDFRGYALRNGYTNQDLTCFEAQPLEVEGFGIGLRLRSADNNETYDHYKKALWEALHSSIT